MRRRVAWNGIRATRPVAEHRKLHGQRTCPRPSASGAGRFHQKKKGPIRSTVESAKDDDPVEDEQWHQRLVGMGRDPNGPWKAQNSLLRIHDEDAISDSGVEIWNLLEHRGIKNVILLGVHTNMCVLGRPFGLRQMAKNGKNVVSCAI
jgi:hypothetical protein